MNKNQASRRNFLRLAGAAGLLALTGAGRQACAESDAGQLRILCGFPAGSVPDLVARLVAGQLTASYPRGCIVENRPGAAGQVSIAALKTSPADGSTVLLAPGAVRTIYPYIYSKLSYDPAQDLLPVSLAAEVTLALAVGPAVPASVTGTREFLDWARDNPRLVNVGSPGVGTPPHLLEAMLFRQAGLPWAHVGYAGGPPAINDLLGGQIAAVVLPEGILRQHRAAGKLRILATSGPQRSSFLPEVPTFAEQGFDKLVVRDWFGFFLPGKAAPGVAELTAQALGKALARPELASAFAESGMAVAATTPASLGTRIAAEQRQWEAVVRENAIHVD